MRKGKNLNGAACGPLPFPGGVLGGCCLLEGRSEYALKMPLEDLNDGRWLEGKDRKTCARLWRMSITEHS